MQREQFRTALEQFKGATVISLETETIPEMAKRNNPYWGRIVKRSIINGMIGWIYANAVNNQRIREKKVADFVPFQRKWGTRVQGTPLVEHNGKKYLEVKIQRADSNYFFDGQPIDAEHIRPFLRAKYPHRQGVDKEVILRDYDLDNIHAFTWAGNREEIT